MKVLLDHPGPFALAHGGFQIQIEQTKAGLEANGVDVEYLRWWDDTQKADIIHYFGRPPAWYLHFAHQKGIKIVLAELLTGQGSRPPWLLWTQKTAITLARNLPEMLTTRMGWEAYAQADACVALTPWEAHLMSYLFGAPREKVHVVPNGVEAVFLNSQPAARGSWLVCTATITERKRVLELAQAAVAAQTPLWIVGKPYAEKDPYAERFLELARQQPRWIRYEGPVNDRTKLAQIYREARGFVLLSTMESLSLSALEAAACGCPLLLSDLPWARTAFGDHASFCPVTSTRKTAMSLRQFHDTAPGLKAPQRPMGWPDVAAQLKRIYENL